MPESTIRTFNLVAPSHMLEKLDRERQRMKSAKSAQDLADHAINFMVTAYHLVDWTWHARVKDSAELRGRFECAERDVGVANAGRGPCERHADAKWLYWKWLTRKCPALDGCREIANASKHFRLESEGPLIKSVSVTAKATLSEGEFGTLSATDNYEKYLVVKTRYSDGDYTTDDQYIQPVLRFWQTLFRDHQLD